MKQSSSKKFGHFNLQSTVLCAFPMGGTDCVGFQGFRRR